MGNPVALKNVAYSIIQINGVWNLVKIRFDGLSGVTSVPELTVIGNGAFEAEEALKITLANELFVQ